MTDDGRVWTDVELAARWQLGLVYARERMQLIQSKGKGELLVLYYWLDEPGNPPIAMRPYKQRDIPAPANVRSGLGLIFRGCTVDNAPQSYKAQIAPLP